MRAATPIGIKMARREAGARAGRPRRLHTGHHPRRLASLRGVRRDGSVTAGASSSPAGLSEPADRPGAQLGLEPRLRTINCKSGRLRNSRTVESVPVFSVRSLLQTEGLRSRHRSELSRGCFASRFSAYIDWRSTTSTKRVATIAIGRVRHDSLGVGPLVANCQLRYGVVSHNARQLTQRAPARLL